ncbi:hypothetical protein [Streptomyces sp. NPDC058718]|uniref:hypothetical protein n=1 Tax=Streptomyces sp. NPDC058718 TaxID=3346610 RepID=UPI0036A13EC8
MTTTAEPGDRLAALGNQVEDILLRLQSLLDELPTDTETGTAPDPTEVRRVNGAPEGLIALVESHVMYEERKLVSALDELDTPLPDDLTLSELTGR